MFGELGSGSNMASTSKLVKVAGSHQFVSLGQALGSHMCAVATRQALPGDWPAAVDSLCMLLLSWRQVCML